MNGTRITTTAALALVAALITGCSRAPDTVTIVRPSTSTSAVASSPSSGGSTSSGSPMESMSPSPGDGVRGVASPSGVVEAKVDGQSVSLSFDTLFAYYIYAPPTGPSSLTWGDSEGDALVVGVDHLYVGTKKTSGSISLQLSLTQPEGVTFVSGNGTCRVTFDKVEKHFLSGSFTCKSVKSLDGKTLDASGSFSSKLNITG